MAEHSDPLDAIIAEYVQQVETGVVPDREALLQSHAVLADRLRDFFADFDRLDRQAAELRLSADPNLTTDQPAVGQVSNLPSTAELPRVCYFGDYELVEVIARGGMGVVYKARQVSLNRLVALKMILKGELATPRDVARFRAEAEAAANLDHPHIVSIYEVGEHDGQQYYAMRYIEGASLTRRPRADTRNEAALVAVVARAVYYAHQHGILHRDLKPSNILVDPAGVPFVADFGLAKRVDADRSLTVSGDIVGTPRYMAPEQAAARKDLTVAVDVYSLGVILYERLTGQTPFTGETPLEVLRQVREAEPPRPSSITPGLNRDLETICLKCLEKDPAKRYGSAGDLASDLDRWLRGEPILARPVGQMERFGRWCRRNPVVAGLTATVALLLVMVTAVAVSFGVHQHQAKLSLAEALETAERSQREAELRTESERRERQRAVKAEDELEQALVQRWIGPLGRGDTEAPLTELEAEELLNLAQNPGDRLWERFWQEGLRAPTTTRRIAERAEPALIAATGVNSDKRRRATLLLLGRLQAPDVSAQQQLDLAYLMAQLGDLDPATIERLADVLGQFLSNAWNKDEVWKFVAVAEMCRPAPAARLLRHALEKETDANVRQALADGLARVASRLEPAEAVRVLGQALTKETNAYACVALAAGLARVGTRLEAAEAALVLGRALGKEQDAYSCKVLADGLVGVAARLEAAESARVLSQAARDLEQALAKEPNYNPGIALANGLAGVAASLQPAEAAHVLGQALEKVTESNVRRQLANSLVGVVPRLEPVEGARVLGKALETETDYWARQSLAAGLADAAGRLETREAARVLEQALEKETNPSARVALADRLSGVAAQLEPVAKARVLTETAHVLGQALENETNPSARATLAAGLADAAGRLETGEAARVLRQVLENETNAAARAALATGFAAAAGRLETREAARVLEQALEKETNPSARVALAHRLADVAARLEPVAKARVLTETARMLAETARLLLRALEKETDASVREDLLNVLAEVAERLQPVEKAQVLAEAARVQGQALEKETDANSRFTLANGLASVTAHLEPAESARVLGQARALEKDDSARAALANSLAVAAARLEPAEGARVLRQALEKETNASARTTLADGLAGAAARLPPTDAAKVCVPVIQQLVPAAAAATESSGDRYILALAAAHLVHALEPEMAADYSKRLAFIVCSGRDPDTSYGSSGEYGLVNSLDVVLTNPSPPEVSRCGVAVATAVGLAGGQSFVAVPALPLAGKSLPCRLSTQDLVELLKMPTCFGKAREVVLKHLCNRYGRTFANHWEFVRYAPEKGLNLDFTTPPKRPGQP